MFDEGFCPSVPHLFYVNIKNQNVMGKWTRIYFLKENFSKVYHKNIMIIIVVVGWIFKTKSNMQFSTVNNSKIKFWKAFLDITIVLLALNVY